MTSLYWVVADENITTICFDIRSCT